MNLYRDAYIKFVDKHGTCREWTTLTNGLTHKLQLFEDGAEWYEVYGKHVESVNVLVKGIYVTTTIDLFKIEYWSSEDSISKFAYERY